MTATTPIGRPADASWLTAAQASEFVGVKPDVLARWSMEGKVEHRSNKEGDWYEQASLAELLLRLSSKRCDAGHPMTLQEDGGQWCARCRVRSETASAVVVVKPGGIRRV
jgi:hypothetical protein